MIAAQLSVQIDRKTRTFTEQIDEGDSDQLEAARNLLLQLFREADRSLNPLTIGEID